MNLICAQKANFEHKMILTIWIYTVAMEHKHFYWGGRGRGGVGKLKNKLLNFHTNLLSNENGIIQYFYKIYIVIETEISLSQNV